MPSPSNVVPWTVTEQAKDVVETLVKAKEAWNGLSGDEAASALTWDRDARQILTMRRPRETWMAIALLYLQSFSKSVN